MPTKPQDLTYTVPQFPPMRDLAITALAIKEERDRLLSENLRLREALLSLLKSAEAVHSYGLHEDVHPLTAVRFCDAQATARAALKEPK